MEQVLSAEEQQRKAMEEEERRMAELRRLGTPVTPESFESWRVAFEAEETLQQTRCAVACFDVAVTCNL